MSSGGRAGPELLDCGSWLRQSRKPAGCPLRQLHLHQALCSLSSDVCTEQTIWNYVTFSPSACLSESQPQFKARESSLEMCDITAAPSQSCHGSDITEATPLPSPPLLCCVFHCVDGWCHRFRPSHWPTPALNDWPTVVQTTPDRLLLYAPTFIISAVGLREASLHVCPEPYIHTMVEKAGFCDGKRSGLHAPINFLASFLIS